MLDIRATNYVSPLSEVAFTDVPLTVHIVNYADETGLVTGLFRVYNVTTGLQIHDSEIQPFSLAKGATADVSALTDFSPGAPLDDTYFVLFDGQAFNNLVPDGIGIHLGAFHFDVKPGPLGPPPAAHHTTHELGGSDEIDLTDLVPLDDYQLLAEKGIASGYPELDAAAMVPTIQLGTGVPDGTKYLRDDQTWQVPPSAPNVEDLPTAEMDDTLVLAPDGAGGVEFRPEVAAVAEITDLPTAEMDDTLVLAPDGAGGVEFRAEAGGADTSVTPQTLTDQASIDWDLALGGAAQVTLAGDRTLNAPTNMVDGARYRLKVIQDGTGTRLLTWNAAYRFPGGVDPCLSAAIGNIDIITWDCDGSHLDATGMTSALA